MKIVLRQRAPTTPLPVSPRAEQALVLDLIAADKPVLVTATRNNGLTTLLLSIAKSLQTDYGLASCFLSGRDLAQLSSSQCYTELVARLCELIPQVRCTATDALSLRRSLLDILRISTKGIILLIDDVHLAPCSWWHSFLNMLQSIGHEAYLQPLWQKFGCVLGSHDIDTLADLDLACNYTFLHQVQLQPLNRTDYPGLVRETAPILVIDALRPEVRYDGRLLALFPQELKILLFLASQPERYFSEAAIYRGISEQTYGADLGAVNLKAPIARLRKKLPSRELIHTRRGIGYAFRPVLPYKYIDS